MKPGLYPAMPMAEYLADPCPVPSLSSGCAHRLLTLSPFHAWFEHPRLGKHPGDDSNAADIGTVAHDILLRGEGKIAVIDPNDYPGKRGGIPDGWTNDAIRTARDDARAAGLTPVLREKFDAAQRMADAARNFIAGGELAGVFEGGAGEQTMIWREDDTWFRARPDWLTADHSVMLHVKTTQGSAQPDSWIRNQLVPCGYDLAAMFYERGLFEMRIERDVAPNSVFLVIEQNEPHGCSLVALSPLLAEFADKKLNKAIDLWNRCMASGRWPAYPSRICHADPPTWAMRDWEEKEAVGAYDPETAMEL